MMNNNTFTICSVSFNSKKLLELNYQITRKFNPDTSFEWIVVENSPHATQNRFNKSDRNFKVIYGDDYNLPHASHKSYHHAYGINKALQSVRTQYVLILDPDFFIIRYCWIKDIIAHIKNNNLSFFGAPYHPSRYIKYRYFPCAICMFVDLEKVKKDDLDFTPKIYSDYSKKIKGSSKNNLDRIFNFSKKIIRNNKFVYINLLKLINFYEYTFFRAKIIGSSRDTGYDIYSKFSVSPKYKYECLIPVYMRKDQKKDIIQKIAEPLLPDRWCYLPKKHYSFSEIGFSDLGHNNIQNLGWEEYLWREEAFGFHLRDLIHGNRMLEIDNISSILDYFKNNYKKRRK